MDIKNFVLSYYKNASEDFHIQKKENSIEARKPHTHEYFQIYFITKGSLLHHVENESSALSHGDMFIIPPGKTHYIAPEKDTVFYSFSFMPKFLSGQNENNKLVKNFLRFLMENKNQNIKAKISIKTDEIFYIEKIMEHILKEFQQKPLGYRETIYAYAIILITMIARNYYKNDSKLISVPFENNKQLVLHCINYIDNNFADNITLEEISRRFTMSKSNFCSLFAQLTGCTFNSYLNKCRIKKATEYIKKGYKITAVYGLCGYNDFSTFYRNFIKILGISPQEYRKNQGKPKV